MNYRHTHESVYDRSQAMCISDTPFTLMNEDGYEWTADPDEWNNTVSVEMQNGVTSVLGALAGEVYYRSDNLEAVIIGDGFVIAVDHQGNTSEATVGEWSTGYEA